MSRQKTPHELALEAAAQRGYAQLVDYFGSANAMATMLGLTRQAVSKWNGVVPRRWVITLEEHTRRQVTRFQLRPDIYGQARVPAE